MSQHDGTKGGHTKTRVRVRDPPSPIGYVGSGTYPT
jgi:hypothetical protein